MQHFFDIDIAKKYGWLEAVLLNNLYYWIEKNKANSQNFHDGYYWTYNSTKAFNELFPYVSERQIKNALKHLRREGIIQTGNYNKMPYDRTLWYSFTNKGEAIMKGIEIDEKASNYAIVQKCPMDSAKMSNGKSDNVRPIPNNKPDINTDNNNIRSKKVFEQETFEKEFEEVWKEYPNKKGKPKAKASYIKARKSGETKENILSGLKKYKQEIEHRKIETQFIKNGDTWFRNECWNDEYETRPATKTNTNSGLINSYDFEEDLKAKINRW